MAKTKTSKRRRTSSDDVTATKKSRAAVERVPSGDVSEDQSMFLQLVEQAGLVLTTGNQPNQLSVDQAVFQRNLRLAIRNHQEFPQVVDEFLQGLQAHVEDPDRFSCSLLATVPAAACEESCRGGNQDCLMRLLLGVEIIQPKVMIVLLEKLPEFMGDDDQVIDSNAAAQIPRLILNQFRWLDRIVDSKLLCSKMLEMLGITTLDIQRDIISCLPEVIEDTEHNNLASQLKDKLNDRQLMVAVLDALSNLNVRPDLLTEIRLSVLQKVPRLELQDLPVVVKFLLQSVSAFDVVEVVQELRDQLDLTPGLSAERGAAAEKSCRGSEALILDAIRSGITFQKTIAEAWIKDTVPPSRKYEAKRKRCFLEKWRTDYDFVDYDYQAEMMYCKKCRAMPTLAKGNALFHGVTGDKVRSRTLKIHAKVNAHTNCVAALEAAQNPEEAPIRRALQHVNVVVEDKMIKLFNTAYFVAKEEAPFTLFPKLLGLQAKNGVALGQTYHNDQACRTFVSEIGECMKEESVAKVRQARFFSVMSDSSMDRSILDQELIYMTYLEDGLTVSRLVNIVSLQHAHARGITDAILEGLENVAVTRDDLTRRLVGFGSDGASVMIGVNNGVAAKLKEFCPSVVSVWCVAHRLELAALDTIKHNPLLAELKETLKSIYKHYTESAKATRELRSVGELLGVQVVKPGNVNGCRWLPHMYNALEALVRNYQAIMVHFENHANDENRTESSATMRGRAKAIHRSLSRFKMVKFIHLMLDILQELKQASLLFQKDGLTLQHVSEGLGQVTLALMEMQAVENVPHTAEHKDVDVLVLMLLHSTAVSKTRRRAVEGLFRTKVRSGKFTHDLLRKTFTSHAHILREYFQSVLTIAEVLLRSPEPAVELFGCHMYQEAFSAFDVYCRQEVVGSLVTHIGSGVTSEVDSALDVLCQLVRDMPAAMAPFSVFLKGVLDYLDNLSVAQIRKLFSMLGTLAVSGTQDRAHIQDDMHILIRKQLSNTTHKYKRMGVIGAIMMVRSLGAKREERAPSISKDVFDQITGLLGMVRTSCQNTPDEYALFMDELACVMQKRQLDEEVEVWISEDVLTDFQDNYVVDVEADRMSQSSTTLPLDLCYNLEDVDELEEGNIAVNLLPLLEAAEEMKGLSSRKGKKRTVSPACLAPHFRLLRCCEQAQRGGDLEGIDALLGCPLYLFKEETVEKIESLSGHEKELMCTALFHTLNWFREIINGFSSQSDPEMRGKVLVRLQNITHVQELLRTCLAATPGFVPPQAIFDCEMESVPVPGVARKGRKKASKGGKKLPVGEKSPDPNDTISTQDGTQADKDTCDVDKEEKNTSVNLEHYRAFVREFDLEVFSILKCGMVSKSVLDTEMHTKETTVLDLQPTELLFLLKDLNLKLEHGLIATAKRKTFLKTKSERNNGFSHLDLYTAQEVAEQVVQLLPALCDHLESVCTYFQTLLEENDGVVDGPRGDQAQTQLMSEVFSQLLQALARIFSWNGFIGCDGQKLHQQAVSTLAGRIKASSTTQTSTQDMISYAFRYVENFLSTAPNLSTTVCLIRLLVSICDKGSQPEQFNSKIAEHTQTILKREWIGKDGQREKGAKCNEDVQFVLKTFLDFSEDKLSCIEHLASVGIPELVEADRNGCSKTYPTLTRQSLGVFYRAMMSELVVCIKDIPTGKASDAAKVQVERLFRWSIAVRIFHILVNLVKAFDGRVYLSAAQKYGRMFVEVFLRQGMPVLDNVFKTHKDDVHSLLKNLQLSTRAMHHMCGFSKVSKDVSLTNYVPLVKKTLEMFVYRVKAMLTMNKCLDAFWLGNLKNRDLQGEEISSQAYADPTGRQSDDDTDNDATELPDDDDDDDSDTTNLEEESVCSNDQDDSVGGESYSESY